MEINFTEENGVWKGTISPLTDAVTLEIERAGKGTLHVYANLTGMSPIRVYNVPPYGRKDIIVSLDIKNAEITIESQSPVTSAKYE